MSEEAEEQALSFAYGNAALSSRHKPNRVAFKKTALERGWTEDHFETWARKRAWWLGGFRIDDPERSPDAVAKIRLDVVRAHGEPKNGFTCDDCGARFTCTLVFDMYNTNGDCLVSGFFSFILCFLGDPQK